jgi:hydroxymethylglutaryl-CoA lyase
MNQKNIRMSLDDTWPCRARVIERGAAMRRARVQAYLAVAFECPFEGPVDAGPRRAKLAAELLDAGAAELVIADTIGAANPAAVRALTTGWSRARQHTAWPATSTTRGRWAGQRLCRHRERRARFDASVGGLGGCPFAPGRAGQRRYGGRGHALRAGSALTPGSTCQRSSRG